MPEYFKGRDHRERKQPKERAKLGFLEKHKDYVKRAQAYHSKQTKLQKLRRAAALKNPDEFQFGMHKKAIDERGQQVTIEDKWLEFDANTMSPDEMPKLQKKDWVDGMQKSRSYLQMQHAIDTKNIERLKGTLADLDHAGADNEKTIFVDEEEAAQQILKRGTKRKLGVETTVPEIERDPSVELKLRKTKARQYKELQARIKRQAEIGDLINHLDFEKKRTHNREKGLRRRVENKAGYDAPVVKFARQRQK
jgi:U3 small nucleolar RNA-associated protein 11|uniref:U3 small nucleolar RNA-associated protein 11 n=1 Tax=Eutreptiella gymnastica TaxID=73025 RepID=A0A7S4G6H4_9EUGL|mmetsp:Transcript_7706/g.14800  ORF Transcript_7706/g.14800 Transcript_7706/m.14800 type:complete len:251 (+) Transcript_7706:25-777(+)|eukprot:CAMPEP_0174293876 /NCGR_PEP_ID=MMETSP0809-20121228/39946_1 /TAXON_ID=73025 ORGANISM="Eutreptiella gymnastica-like, Strain CCMP1594" /NCGR_SAMPLE_ID=MMETSP0809 /ASSEMBLY_ACC=CAM_ASM_000658 /LENGTH=250 /DNA_ID=CAMNT_0015394963 /DNA_START=25 /DNA_END=777 /DNA_ORIENTATION=+